MPIEIRELHIKVTVPAEDDGEDAFRFGGLAPVGRDVEDAAIPDDPAAPMEPDPFDLTLGDAVGHATAGSGANFPWRDGSVRFALDAPDPFS
jgi:hypothetical protein